MIAKKRNLNEQLLNSFVVVECVMLVVNHQLSSASFNQFYFVV